MCVLRHAASWLRGIVGRNLRLRFAPEIRFFPDDTLDRVYHLEEIFRELHAGESDGDSVSNGANQEIGVPIEEEKTPDAAQAAPLRKGPRGNFFNSIRIGGVKETDPQNSTSYICNGCPGPNRYSLLAK